MNEATMNSKTNKNLNRWKLKTYEIIFKADTPWGKRFDIILLSVILISIVLVMIESVPSYQSLYGEPLRQGEWIITILFTIEYILRIVSSPKPLKYLFSFLGIIDFLAVIPTYLGLIVPDAQALAVIRAIRLLRIYRILRLYHFLRAGRLLILSLQRSARKILIFMMFVVILVILLGSIMYVIEGGENGFYSIPLSIYWAVITLTTVGYGDIVPVTALGKFISTFIMLLGYSIIAIPTGIVSVEMSHTFNQPPEEPQKCPRCGESNHAPGSNFCRICGARLNKK
ncbi:ion transporter [Geofilum sp. OHC36d9]|uniref:ion transporter n=1 Tax=Geofilum sp. OHC36d9 TaxID=3458413 RepID=UPI0040347D20